MAVRCNAGIQALQRAHTISAGRARRGWIILLVANGIPIVQVAATVGISRCFVYTWVQRLLQQGLEGFADQPRPSSHHMPPTPALAEQHDREVGERHHAAC